MCGRVRGYQFGYSNTFLSAAREIDSWYVDGVSLTHGQNGSRTHIWTFAAGLADIFAGRTGPYYFCSCVTDPGSTYQPPAEVGNDYFCESGLNTPWVYRQLVFYPDDPLWDGQNCASSSCCEFNNPPYFTKTLPAPTSDDIELRICSRYSAGAEDTPIDQVELYVQ